jgi:hypothetical protein
MNYKYETVRDAIEDLGIEVKTRPGVPELIVTVGLISNDEKKIKSFKEEVAENQPLYQILEHRLEACGYGDKIHDSAKIAMLGLGLRVPGEVVLYAIELMDLFDQTGKVTSDNVYLSLYPEGFYDKETTVKIVDNILKPKLTKHSKCY